MKNNFMRYNEVEFYKKEELILLAEGTRSQLELPIFGGNAVYRARAILQLDVDDTYLSYRMLSQLLSISNKYKIYPIPNKGVFTILKIEESVMPTKIAVYDLHEKLISTTLWPENTNELKVNLQGVSPGLYLVQITSVDGSVVNLKTIVTP